MSKVDYYAGFFDGEGSVGIYKNGQGRWHLRTQVTQNINTESTGLLEEIRALYGGNIAVMRGATYLRGAAYNWQTNGRGAASFLQDLYPALRLKRDQAQVAIAWQELQPGPQRAPNGRMLPAPYNEIDEKVSTLLKLLKKSSVDDVMAAQSDLVDIVHTLRQVVCVKG